MKKLTITRLMIGDLWLEKDINDNPRLIMKDELGEEWVMSQETTGHGFMSVIKKKSTCWYFDEKNRHKKATPFV